MSNIKVIGLGALNIDHIYQVESILGDGETAVNREHVERIHGYRRALGTFPGGSAANTIYGLARLGVSTVFIGAVGDDAEGKLLLQDFEKVGVDTGQIKVKPKAKTGFTQCLSDKLNFRKISVSRATANSLLAMNDIDLDYLNRAEVLHISSFVDDAQLGVLLKLMDKLDSSVKVSFSPGALYAGKGLKALAPILGRTHVLFINQSEIKELTGQDVITGAESCLKQGCQIVAVTSGRGLKLDKGANRRTVSAVAYIRDAEGEYVIEPDNRSRVPKIDTTGAGDAFAAGFLCGLLEEKSLKECGRLGDIVAQFAITKTGARQGLPTPNELKQRYQQLFDK